MVTTSGSNGSSSSTGSGSGSTDGSTSGSVGSSSAGGSRGTDRVDVPAIANSAMKFSGAADQLDVMAADARRLADYKPIKGGVDETWTRFESGGYRKGITDFTVAIAGMSKVVQALHDGLISSAQTLQDGEKANTDVTAKLRKSMEQASATRLGGGSSSVRAQPSAPPGGTKH